MHIKPVEIYSDASNAVVLRHPGRKFAGVLVQGDTLHSLVAFAKDAYASSDLMSEDARDGLAVLLEKLQDLQHHYETTLISHGLALPYPRPGA
jgi:hypothetical protein